MKKITAVMMILLAAIFFSGCSSSAASFDVKKEQQAASKQLTAMGKLFSTNETFSRLNTDELKQTLTDKLSDFVTKDELRKMKSEIPQWQAGNYANDLFFIAPRTDEDKAVFLATTPNFTDSHLEEQTLIFQLDYEPEANFSGTTVKLKKEDGTWKVDRIVSE
ncbi:hypothetical protein [Brochothrix campestris]|uniref:Lipoprotein n=1 Tax=Brochothrix campestris FSL F6-1037 TaxID=1265861 RepID=W7CZ16_9LIST|nr:hypothetical protein [Brochothrix campestris]EUJ42005.1 hypothetical protein BCAMP_01350 [Brochothrix campestris FSL F6-1037]